MASVQPSTGGDQLVVRVVRTWWTGLPEVDKAILTGFVLLATPLTLVVLWLLLTLK
jgi:hypothetical protein